MYQTIFHYLFDLLYNTRFFQYVGMISVAVYLVAVVILSILVRAVLRFVLFLITRQLKKHIPGKWPAALLHHKLPQRLANIAIPLVIALTAGADDPYGLLSRATGLSGVIVIVLLVNALFGAINEIYEGFEVSKIRPIKGLLQVIQVAILIVCAVVGIAILLGQNPMVFVGSIGALTAVISFIFKDPILGFVAGIQLTANNMVRIGDWIEMPKYSLDGDVVEISMTTVKVQNFDQTITSVPAQSLVNDAFVNWRGMQEAGGRRIKRSIRINASSVTLCTDEMVERLQLIDLIRDYLQQKRSELEALPEEIATEHPDELLNTRRLTNLGTFRAYMAAYLKGHAGIHQNMTIMVRQLAHDDKGIPLEVYAFTNTTEWERYEDIQSDIFDHFYSAAPLFGLEVYQSPSGQDVRSIAGLLES